ncbi:MAG: SDR family NAD(P)-dependent oxidoreductase [Cyanobacteria bacterium P01_H01_bin.21]
MDASSRNLLSEMNTLLDLLSWRSASQPDQLTYTVLEADEVANVSFSNRELLRRAQGIGAQLLALNSTGERILLLLSPGLNYISAFFGCLYAGAIAVPVYPPRANRRLSRLEAIISDAQPSIVLTTSDLSAKLKAQGCSLLEVDNLTWIAVDEISSDLANQWQQPSIEKDSLAFLQYTSGSTAAPKGVMVSHRNLLHNLELINQHFGASAQSRGVIWLPPYHDMGLIGGILQPLYAGSKVFLMRPVDFLQRPIRWLQAISQYQANISGGPNFAYELCLNRITPEARAGLDLSTWNLAFSGAEPVRTETLDRFAETFEPCGFRREAFYPCYGMAEATLFISGGQKSALPVCQAVEAASLQRQKVVYVAENDKGSSSLVGCGKASPPQSIVIVNPDSCRGCDDNQVGEIWVSNSESIAQGYWHQPEKTQAVFQAYLSDTGAGPFLRTGDLGFLRDGELFVTGRLKDLIIIRGRNYYPQDIEVTVEQAHPALRPGCGAAFSVDVDAQEQLVVVQEVHRSGLRNLNVSEITQAVRQAISEHHDLRVYAILLLKTGSIPKTSSGKIQRHACKGGFQANTLNVVGDWLENPQYKTGVMLLETDLAALEQQVTSTHSIDHSLPQELLQADGNTLSIAAIEKWLTTRLSRYLNIDSSEINSYEPFSSYGLDSAAAVSLSGELEEWLGRRLSPTLIYDYPSIIQLSQYLAVDPLAESARATMDAGKTESEISHHQEAIAIVGMGCRFPGADSPEAFWDLLSTGQNAVTQVSRARLDLDAHNVSFDANTWGGFLEAIDQFDAAFFGIAPREAEKIDPQQRWLLEVAWQALEHAGQSPTQLSGSQTGVFVGISSNDYARKLMANPSHMDAYIGTGNALSIAANRLSYVLNLQGPSLAVDTACSSSLVALHLACHSLRRQECNLALVSGVNALLSPELTQAFSQAQMLAADGRCKTFDSDADGYVRGEGCGVVVLKRLSEARAAGDRILAIVRGSAISQDGRSNGLTAPNGLAQQAVIRQALANANIAPAEIQYVEAHGTGTSLGDPIEVDAIQAVLAMGRAPEAKCYLGSVKTNLGHLEAAAGIAGLIKGILALQHQQIPSHLNLNQLNPYISLEPAFNIATEAKQWTADNPLQLAGVSSFGFGGTNAHVILEAADRAQQPPQSIQSSQRPWQLLALSAKTEPALHELMQRYKDFLLQVDDTALADICFTANTGRAHFAHRVAISAASKAQLLDQLTQHLENQSGDDAILGEESVHSMPRIAFLFTGQGSQYVQMGRQLYDTCLRFRQILEQCDEILRDELGESILSVLYPLDGQQTGELNQTCYTQPTLFALEYALAELWHSWGIKPDVVMGHSVGEYVAACVAGVFSLADGLKLIAARGRLMQTLPQDGGMVVIASDEVRVRQLLQPYDAAEIAIAAINGPNNVVISGRNESITHVIAQCQDMGIKTKTLQVSHAFHSPLMAPMLAEFRQVASEVTFALPNKTLVSTQNGKIASAEVATPDYWVNHVLQPVRFAAAMNALQQDGCKVFLEVGPQPTLLGMGQTCLPEHLVNQCLWLPSVRSGQTDWSVMLKSLGQLYVSGVSVDWDGFEGDYPERLKVSLPTYPFQRQRYWVESSQPQSAVLGKPTQVTELLNQGDITELSQLVAQQHETSSPTETLEQLVRVHQRQLASQSVQDLMYTVEWIAADALPVEMENSHHWLVFATSERLGQEVIEQLDRHGQTSTLVQILEDEQLQENVHANTALNPDSPSAFEPLWHQLNQSKTSNVAGILWLSSLDEVSSEVSSVELTASPLFSAVNKQCVRLLYLMQSLVQQSELSQTKLWVATQNGVALGSALPAVEQAPLRGMSRIFGLEHPQQWGGLIDLDSESSIVHKSQVLTGEVLTNRTEDQVAYRNNNRYVARLVSRQPVLNASVSIDPEGSYLISGGLGGLGLTVAQWLVEQGARQLILLSRRGADTSAKQAAVAHLDSMGVRVKVAAVDVSDATALGEILADLSAPFSSIRGVVHAAGLDGGLHPIGSLAPTVLEQTLAPKVQGSWNLHQQSLDWDIDFFINFSSIAAVWGSGYQAHYGAANEFQNLLSEYRRHQGLPSLTINWSAINGVGMMTNADPAHMTKLSDIGITPLEVPHMTAALAVLLGSQVRQCVVADIDWQKLNSVYQVGRPRRLLQELLAPEVVEAQSVGQSEWLRELQLLSASEQREILKRTVQEEVAQVLGLGAEALPDVQVGFFELGMDSLMAVELRSRLSQRVGIPLSSTVAFDFPNIERLSEYLANELLELTSETNADPRTPLPLPGLDEPIAIVGMGCRFPGGVESPEDFWQLLSSGRDAHSEIPSDRWDVESYYDPDPEAPGKMLTRSGHFVKDVEQFDPAFFGISPREAVAMDPQHRLLLEVSWEALERAGQPHERLSESVVGIFVGNDGHDYEQLLQEHCQAMPESPLVPYVGVGSHISSAAGRLAYTLGFTGPTITLDTACSSSLVAVHQACNSLRLGECEMALAGGVKLHLTPAGYIGTSRARMLSPDGHCKTFDASADGYGRGEGCGLVVLKRLQDAERAGDEILALIRGSAVNQDGPSSGLTVPNGQSQQRLMQQALAQAKVLPTEVSYLEAHGTGTSLGDPIEVNAAMSVLGEHRSVTHPLWLGSVKTNIGHLEAAAGISGLMKVVLSLQHRQIPAHLHLDTPNPKIDWQEWLQVPQELTEWASEGSRIAGVSAFGFTGTNAHVVLEEPPSSPAISQLAAERPLNILTLSAKTSESLLKLAERYGDHVIHEPDQRIGDMCFSANTGRLAHTHRLSVVAATKSELSAKLRSYASGQSMPGVTSGEVPSGNAPKLAMLFTGQGSQYVEMGRELYETQPTFRQTLDECAEILDGYLEQPLLSVLYPTEASANEESLLAQTAYTQPALFALEYSLYQLWRSWGIEPTVVMGHSVGEYVAACVAGVFSLADGLKLIAKRGQLMGQLPAGGTMVSVMASTQRVREMIDTQPEGAVVAIAALNGPESTVISGEVEAVQQVVGELEEQGIKTKTLQVSHAFHSPLMELMLDEFRQVAQQVSYRHPQLKLISNVTGAVITEVVATPEYWCEHILQPVNFVGGMATLEQQGCGVMLECGPTPILLGMARQCVSESEECLWLPSLRRQQSDWQQLLSSVSQLYVVGVSLDWDGFERDYPQRRKVSLPTYPFQRQRYWVESSAHALSQQPILTSEVLALLEAGNTSAVLDQLQQREMYLDTLSPEALLEQLSQLHQRQRIEASVKELLYETAWQVHPPLLDIAISPSQWLLISPGNGLSKSLSAQMKAAGHHCEELLVASMPTTTEELTRYLTQLVENHILPLAGIIYLSPAEPLPEDWSNEECQTHLQQSLWSVVTIVQSVSQLSVTGLKLWVVTSNAQAIESSVVHITQRSLWGLGGVIALEYPEQWGGLIDLETSAAADIGASQIWSEIIHGNDGITVAYRQQQRYLPELVRSAGVNSEPSVSVEHSYLISGGLGALGLQVAEWLSEQGAGHLVLLGRRGITTESQQAVVERLRDQGTQVEVLAVDVSDERALTEQWLSVSSKIPPLRGVIHAAGILDDGLLQGQTWERFATVLSPKAQGGWNLHRLTESQDLDFFICFSSAASVLGSLGQSNYAAANAFLDGLCAYRRQLGLVGLSLNWGPWEGGGMASTLSSALKARMSQMGLRSLSVEQGLQTLKQQLGNQGQVSVLAFDWERLIDRLNPQQQSFFASVLPTDVLAKAKQSRTHPSATLQQELARATASEQREILKRTVQAEVGQVLGLGADALPAPQVGFFELGMDSLMAVELRNRLSQRVGLTLSSTVAFDFPNIDQLSEYLAQELLEPDSEGKATALRPLTLPGFDEPIAIVGMGCRFPGGVESPEDFWEMLQAGRDGHGEIPSVRWDVDAYYDPDPDASGKMVTRHGHFVDNVDQFDPGFFGISPREAVAMDPQHRLLLEVSWEALERAGQKHERLSESVVGIFVGNDGHDYEQLLQQHCQASPESPLVPYVGVGSHISSAAGRLAYTLGFTGPTITLDTACSSSLVAVHQACNSLRLGECEMALAGGVKLHLTPAGYIGTSRARMLSPDGHCKTFDASADGYGRGEGCGLVVLKRLQDAERAGDEILALIRGSAVNQDGPSSGLTVPNGQSQQRLMQQALAQAKVLPTEVSYLEAHGTGTSLGDPIEVNAAMSVLGENRPQTEPLWLGSVKTNIGHLEAAAGISGLIKVVLSLQHRQIPAHLHLDTPNPKIDWQNWLQVPQELTDWQSEDRRIAGVSAFGFTGTNAHVVLEEAPPLVEKVIVENERPLNVLTLSAKTSESLLELAERYGDHLINAPEHPLSDVCFSANTGRLTHNHRLSVVATSGSELSGKLRSYAAGQVVPGVVSGEVPSGETPKLTMLFTGQGSQYVKMGRELYETQPTFRQVLDECAQILDDYLDQPLLEVLYPTDEANEESLIDQTAYTQPALFALEYSLYQLWRSWGIEPDVVMGHSVGEYVAACVAGVFSLADGLKLIAKRGQLMGQLPAGGTMVSVMASAQRVREMIDTQSEGAVVAIAAINGPESTVISGEADAVQQVVGELEEQGIKTKTLQVSHAFHSPLMEPMVAEFRQVAQQIDYREPTVKLISNVTGELVSNAVSSADYWCEHILQPVNFVGGMATLEQQGCGVMLECGPQPILLGMARHCLGESDTRVWLPSLRRQQSDWRQLLSSVSQLYAIGVSLDWVGFERDYPQRRKVSLPTYPFQRQRYWVESSQPGLVESAQTTQVTDLLNQGNITKLSRLLRETSDATETLEQLVKVHQQQLASQSVQELMYAVEWMPVELPPIVESQGSGHWLIFAASESLGKGVIDQLHHHGHTTTLIIVSDEDLSQSQDHADYVVCPDSPAAFDRLWHHLDQDISMEVVGILWLSSINEGIGVAPTVSRVTTAVNNHCTQLLYLMQSLVQQSERSQTKLWVVTQNGVVIGPEDPAIEQAPLRGMSRIFGLEHPGQWGGLIDLESGAAIEHQAQVLIHEVLKNATEDQVAYRNNNRYVARLVSRQLTVESPISICSEGSYLISGGMGGLGLAIAQWLADQGARYLILLSRQGANTPVKQAAVEQLTSSGIQVWTPAVDVTDEIALAEVLSQRPASLPPIQGVIHAAGITGGLHLTDSLEPAVLEQTLAPKVSGSWNLHQLSLEWDLDFFVNFSSIAAVWGSAYQAHYGAANEFQNLLSEYRRNRGLPSLTINWSAIADVGMMTEADTENTTRLTDIGITFLQVPQMTAALGALLGSQARHCVVADVDWQKLNGVYQVGRPRRLLEQLIESEVFEKSSSVHNEWLNQLQALPIGEQLSVLKRTTQEEVAQVLGLEEGALPDPQVGFFELGMDSLMAVELRSRLSQRVGIPLSSTVAFDFPNIERLSEYLAQELLDLNAEPDAGSRSPLPLPGFDEPIAIVGMGCRFPGGVESPEAFWELLSSGRDAHSEIPSDRWDVDAYYDPDPDAPGKMLTRSGHFVKDVDQFDPAFFGISPREAVAMDPQHRLLLEVSWEALERAGQKHERLSESVVGIFIGNDGHDYEQLLQEHCQVSPASPLVPYVGVGSHISSAAGRLAYTLGFTGPTITLDTACSSSLVAVHQACNSLRLGECEMALAGGVKLHLMPAGYIGTSRARMLSPDGHCKTFDASADGYGRGEGCGLVVLKRLQDAERAGDEILALIRGSAVNQDGPSSGLTVPNGQSQQRLMQQALAQAKVLPTEVSYLEAHGTGTSLGDPIEVNAAMSVLGDNRSETHPLWLGSVKTNIGHLEAAAGISGLMKVVLSLQHRQIPAHLHLDTPNPKIDWQEWLQVPQELTEWQSDGARIAGVSAFGFTGTNAHVVLEEPPTQVISHKAEYERPLQVLTLSAKSVESLSELAERYGDHVIHASHQLLSDVCFSANTGRVTHPYRLSVLANTSTDLSAKLRSYAAGQVVPGVFSGEVRGGETPKLAMLFTGQGAQYVEMGRELYETQPTFRQTLDECAQILDDYLEQSLLSILYPTDEMDNSESLLAQTAYTQPALFALEYALYALWRSWGIEPDVVMGHSVGEYVAACVAGVFSLADGLKLIAKRGQLMGYLPAGGTMVSVMASAQVVREIIESQSEETIVSIAAINGPESTVISGEAGAVQQVVTHLEAQGIKTKALLVSHAFHSPLMAPMVDEFRQVTEQVSYGPPKLKLISNVTGELVSDVVSSADYWCEHILQPVNFVGGMATLEQQGCGVMLECGPQPILLGMARQCLGESDTRVWLPSLRRQQSDWHQLLSSVSQLCVTGISVDWDGFERNYPQRCKVSLPTYPFQRQRYWVTDQYHSDGLEVQVNGFEKTLAAQLGNIHSTSNKHPLLGQPLMTAAHRPGEHLWLSVFDSQRLSALGENGLLGSSGLFLGTYVEMALAAANTALGVSKDYRLSDLELHTPFVLPEDHPCPVQVVLVEQPNGLSTFQVYSRANNSQPAHQSWILHASANIHHA